jgi:hypothetical protein
MNDRLTLAPDLLPRIETQLDGAVQTLHATALQLSPLEDNIASASDGIRRARQTLTQTGDSLANLRADVAHRAVLLGIRVPPTPPLASASSAPPKNWWEVAWGNLSHGVSQAWNFVEKNKDVIHTVLNVVGMIPIVGDVANGVNALLYLGEGDYADAALSAVALIPLAADGILAARLGVKALGYVKDLGVAEKLLVEGDNVTKVSLMAMSDVVEGDSQIAAAFKVLNRDVSHIPEVGKTVDALSKLEELRNWDTLTTDSQKLEVLQKIEDTHAAATGRPALPVQPDNPELTSLAAYDNDAKKIFVDRDLLGKPLRDIVDTMTHEGRHAFQDFWAARPEDFSDPELARQWAENMQPGNYVKQADDPIGYFTQPVEYDATPYGRAVADGLFEKLESGLGDAISGMDAKLGAIPPTAEP